MNKARRNFMLATAAAVTGLFGLVAARQLGSKPLANNKYSQCKARRALHETKHGSILNKNIKIRHSHESGNPF